MSAFIAGQLAKSAYGMVAKDRNILIPMDNPKGTSIVTTSELKKKICTESDEVKKLKEQLKKAKAVKKRKAPKTNLEKAQSRVV
jgi:hypothetical protein